MGFLREMEAYFDIAIVPRKRQQFNCSCYLAALRQGQPFGIRKCHKTPAISLKKLRLMFIEKSHQHGFPGEVRL